MVLQISPQMFLSDISTHYNQKESTLVYTMMSLLTIKRTQTGILNAIFNSGRFNCSKVFFSTTQLNNSGIRTVNKKSKPTIETGSQNAVLGSNVAEVVTQDLTIAPVPDTQFTKIYSSMPNNGIKTFNASLKSSTHFKSKSESSDSEQPIEKMSKDQKSVNLRAFTTHKKAVRQVERRLNNSESKLSKTPLREHEEYPVCLDNLRKAVESKDLKGFTIVLNDVIYNRAKPDPKVMVGDIFPLVNNEEFISSFTPLVSKLIYQLPQVGISCRDDKHKHLYLALFRKYAEVSEARSAAAVMDAPTTTHEESISFTGKVSKLKNQPEKYQTTPFELQGALQGLAFSALSKHHMKPSDRIECMTLVQGCVDRMQGSELASVLQSLFRMSFTWEDFTTPQRSAVLKAVIRVNTPGFNAETCGVSPDKFFFTTKFETSSMIQTLGKLGFSLAHCNPKIMEALLQVVSRVLANCLEVASQESVTPAQTKAINEQIVHVLYGVSRMSVRFLNFDPLLANNIFRVIEFQLPTFDAHCLSTSLNALGMLKMMFGELTMVKQQNIYSALVREFPNMNLDQLARSMQGLAMLKLEFKRATGEFRVAFYDTFEQRFGTDLPSLDEAVVLARRKIGEAKTGTVGGNFRLSQSTWDRDQTKLVLESKSVEERLQHDADSKTLASLLFSMGNVNITWEHMRPQTKTAIMRSIFQLKFYEDHTFAVLLRGLRHMNVHWHGLNETYKNILFMNMYNPHVFKEKRAMYISSALVSLAIMNAPWYLLPCQKWNDFIGTKLDGKKLSETDVANMFFGFGHLGARWSNLSLPCLHVLEEGLAQSRLNFTEKELANLMFSVSLLSFDFDHERTKAILGRNLYLRKDHPDFHKYNHPLNVEQQDHHAQELDEQTLGDHSGGTELNFDGTVVRNDHSAELKNTESGVQVVEMPSGSTLKTANDSRDKNWSRLMASRDATHMEQLAVLERVHVLLCRKYSELKFGKAPPVVAPSDKVDGENNVGESAVAADADSTVPPVNLTVETTVVLETTAAEEIVAAEETVAPEEIVAAEETPVPVQSDNDSETTNNTEEVVDWKLQEQFAVYFELLNFTFPDGDRIVAQNVEGGLPEIKIEVDEIYNLSETMLDLIPPMEDALWIRSNKYRTSFCHYGLHYSIFPMDCAVLVDNEVVANIEIDYRTPMDRAVNQRHLKLKEHLYFKRYTKKTPFYRVYSSELDKQTTVQASRRLADLVMYGNAPSSLQSKLAKPLHMPAIPISNKHFKEILGSGASRKTATYNRNSETSQLNYFADRDHNTKRRVAGLMNAAETLRWEHEHRRQATGTTLGDNGLVSSRSQRVRGDASELLTKKTVSAAKTPVRSPVRRSDKYMRDNNLHRGHDKFGDNGDE